MNKPFDPSRRKVLAAGVSSLFLAVAAAAGYSQVIAVPPFAAAVDLIARRYVNHGRNHVHGPVSLLQRHLLLGYRDGCALVAALERAGAWCITESAQGRTAQIDPAWPHWPRALVAP